MLCHIPGLGSSVGVWPVDSCEGKAALILRNVGLTGSLMLLQDLKDEDPLASSVSFTPFLVLSGLTSESSGFLIPYMCT